MATDVLGNHDLICFLASPKYLPDLWDVIRLSGVNRRLREVLTRANADLRLFWTVNGDFTIVRAHHSPEIPVDGNNPPCSLESHEPYRRPDGKCKHQLHNGCSICYGEKSITRLNVQLACKAYQRYDYSFYKLGNRRVALAFLTMSGLRGEEDSFRPTRLLKHGHIDLTRECMKHLSYSNGGFLTYAYYSALIGGDLVNRVPEALALVPEIICLSSIESKNVFLRGATDDVIIHRGLTARMLAAVEEHACFLSKMGSSDRASLLNSMASLWWSKDVFERNVDGAVFLVEKGYVSLDTFYDIAAESIAQLAYNSRSVEQALSICEALFTRASAFFDWPWFTLRGDVRHAIKYVFTSTGHTHIYFEAENLVEKDTVARKTEREISLSGRVILPKEYLRELFLALQKGMSTCRCDSEGHGRAHKFADFLAMVTRLPLKDDALNGDPEPLNKRAKTAE